MNFFEHQRQARTQSRWLFVLFLLAIVAIVAVVDLVLLFALGVANEGGGSSPSPTAVLTGGALATTAVIGLASLFRMAQLRSGGGQVARSLGGTLLEPDPADPARRRLRNVVEEIAIASGVPAPEIYVLETESGINAFAAGYGAADAAVAVTRGALEKLNREELQGVIAHEFSHILNGDMRINTRLTGALFGILMLAMIGRRVLTRGPRFGRSRGRGAGAIFLVAAALLLVGMVGQFFGRWIKASVSRQREYLADASAVQFTRNPDGIGGALKKIAAHQQGSQLAVDAEEVSHMLFGQARRQLMFATHPPILDRIRRLDPAFDAAALERLAERVAGEGAVEEDGTAAAALASAPTGAVRTEWPELQALLGAIGQLSPERIRAAGALSAALGAELRRAAGSPTWAPEVLLLALLDADAATRERQLLGVARHLGAGSESRLGALLAAGGPPPAGQRLPLLELALPALRRRPADFLARFLDCVHDLARADQRIELFEYVLARMVEQYLREMQAPHRYRAAGHGRLAASLPQATRLLAMLAAEGQQGTAAAAAFEAGRQALGARAEGGMPEIADRYRCLDEDLPLLDGLAPDGKERLTAALMHAVVHDREVSAAELELLRAICLLLHVPLPLPS